MTRWRTVLALLLGAALLAQGLAYAQSDVAMSAAQTAAASNMPCHDADPNGDDCCCPDATCPDMVTCQAGHAAVVALTALVPSLESDAAIERVSPLHFSNRPTAVFRPPIVVHG